MNSKSTAPFIVVIVILLVIIAGGFFYYNHKVATLGMMTRNNQSTYKNNKMPPGGRAMGMAMTPVTPPAVSDQQTQELTAGTLTSTTKKTFNITGGNFYFVPNKIAVNKGDQVTFVITNAGGVHDLQIDELNLKTPVLHSGEAGTVTFTASKSGSFVYYCSLPGHRAKGMWGTLVVQ